MRLIAPIALAALVLLAACGIKPEPVVIEQEMEVMAESAKAPAEDPACFPGDDGIGGTGCEVD